MIELWNEVRDLILECELDDNDCMNMIKLYNKFLSEWDNKSKIEKLLKQGVDVRYGDYLGWTLLHFAAKAGDIFMISLMKDFGADLNAQNMFGNTPMHIAANWKSPDHMTFVDFLVKSGARTDVVNCIGQTPLKIANRVDNWQVVELLKRKQGGIT